MRVHPLFRLLVGLCIHELYPSLVTCHDSVKKFVPFFPLALKKRQGWPHSLSFVKVSQLFWYPPCTELVVAQSVCDSSKQSSPWTLWKSFRKFWYREMTVSTHALVNFLNKFLSHSWESSLTSSIMHISAPIPKFSAPFPHTTVTYNIVTIYMTQSTNLCRALSFCVKRTNHSTYLTAGGSGNGSVHVLSLFTPTLRNENVWGYAYSKNRSYLLQLSMRFDAMTARLFLPTNRRLILEWPSYKNGISTRADRVYWSTDLCGTTAVPMSTFCHAVHRVLICSQCHHTHTIQSIL